MIPFPLDSQDAGEVRRLVSGFEDRSAAIVVCSLLEDHLLKAINSRFLQHEDGIHGRLFKGTRPLGSFSAKIDLGFLLGLYGINTYKQLHKIRDIRNKFAHFIKPLDFEKYDIKDIVQHMPTGGSVSLFWNNLTDLMIASPEHSKDGPLSQNDIDIFREVAAYFMAMNNSHRDRYIVYTESLTLLLEFLRTQVAADTTSSAWYVNRITPFAFAANELRDQLF